MDLIDAIHFVQSRYIDRLPKLLELARSGTPLTILLVAWAIWAMECRCFSGSQRSKKLALVCGAILGIAEFISIFRPRSGVEHLIYVMFRCGAVSWLTAGVLWLPMVIVVWCYRNTIGRLLRWFRRVRSAWQAHRAERKRAREARRWHREMQEEHRRRLPEENRRAAEIALQHQIATDSQVRRENARLACELMYAQYLPEISARLPREQLDAFMRRYMTDSHNPTEVERRGRELQAIIERHGDPAPVTPIVPPQNLEQLARWFVVECERIDALPVDEDLKDIHMVQLNKRYEELSNTLMKEIRP